MQTNALINMQLVTTTVPSKQKKIHTPKIQYAIRKFGKYSGRSTAIEHQMRYKLYCQIHCSQYLVVVVEYVWSFSTVEPSPRLTM